MSTLDKRIAEWLFLLTFAVAAYFYGGAGWNQNATFDVTRAMVERHTFAIDAYAGNTGDVSYANGHVYANKAPALALLAAIPYAIVHAILGTPQNAVALAIAAYVCTLFTVGIFAALIPALLYRELRRRDVDATWAATVALTIAFATELLPYSSVMMFVVPSGALMLTGCTARRASVRGFATGMATAMNYLCAPALIFFALFPCRGEGSDEAAARPGDPAARPPGFLATLGMTGSGSLTSRVAMMWRFAAGALPPLAALAVYQRLCFGGFFTTSIAAENPRFLTKGAALGVFGKPSFDALYGITLSPYRGLFFFAPVLLLAVIPLVRERVVLAISIVFFAANVCFNGWEGGFGVGARYLVPLVPLWGLALAKARPRALVVIAAVLSFAVNFTAVAVDPQPSATIPRPFTEYLVPLLVHGRFSADVPITRPWTAAAFTGHTSVNRLAHDEAIVFTRHAPGTPAAEWSSFNLGEPLFGAGDARSLIPVAVLLAIGCAAILATTRRAPRASAATPTR